MKRHLVEFWRNLLVLLGVRAERTRAERIAAAKERMLNRYPDRDKIEADMMVKAFKDKTPEQIRENFERATSERSALVAAEKERNDERK